MTSGFAPLSGSGNQEIWLNFYYVSYDQAANTSQWFYEVRYYGNGYGSWGTTIYWALSGFATGGNSRYIPESERYNTYTSLGSGVFSRVHDAAGNLPAGNLRAEIYTDHSSIGSGAVEIWSGIPPRIPRLPGTPPKPTFISAGTTSLTYGIVAPNNGGSPITAFNQQIARNAAFTDGLIAWNSGTDTQVATGLRPDTDHWIRFRAVNAAGAGEWSPALQAKTLATTSPGRSVVPSLDGTAATVNLTPPSAMAGVSSYKIERRVLGSTFATPTTTIPPTVVITGLTPGTSYQWRASAMIDDYQTPWTDWLTVAQPKPNTNPGDYFDGSTPDKADNTYDWLGAINNSRSQITAPGVLGWKIDSYTNGGAAVLYRSTGGESQQYAARMLVTASADGAGIRVGTADGALLAAEVSGNGLYRGRIAVRPSRSQRGRALIAWWASGGALIERTPITVDAVVPAGSWTLLTGTATAPATAVRATVIFEDVAGTGHSPWLGGEFLDLDSALVTLGSDLIDYFDGNTPDTPQFVYEWTGLENRSPSLRREINGTPPNPLADPDCPPIPGAPRPPVIANSCIEETGSWRRYWAVIPESEIFDWLSVVPTITVATSTTPARQVRLRFYENPDALTPLAAGGLPYQSEQIISYMPKDTVVTLDAVSETAWATVAGYPGDLPAEELLYGTGGGPATWPVFSCGTSYLISFDVPLDAPIGNIAIGVSLTTRMS